MSTNKRDKEFEILAFELGFDFSAGFLTGGNYSPAMNENNLLFISGQIPKIGNEIEFQGRIGETLSLEQAQLAAKICIMRLLGIAKIHFGSLGRINKILKMNVYLQSSAEFSLHSEVADSASNILHKIFEEQGQHARTSVGVFSLPKNAALEIDLTLSTN